MSSQDDDELMGPGTDLAFSFGGIFILTTIILLVQFWMASIDSHHWAQQFQEQKKLSDRLTAENKELKARYSILENRLEARAEQNNNAEKISALQELVEKQSKQIQQDENALRSAQKSTRDSEERRQVAEAQLRTALRKISELDATATQLTLALKNANDKPPLLKVNDERGVSIFAQGSAEPTPTLLQWLNAVYPVLIENGAKYGTNVIEVTGHTDELPVGQVMQERKISTNRFSAF